MIPADLYSLLAHLWQSTLCFLVAWLLTLALKNNRVCAVLGLAGGVGEVPCPVCDAGECRF